MAAPILGFSSRAGVAEPSSRRPPVTLTPNSGGICPAQLDQAIAAIVNRPEFRRGRWGIVVQTLGGKTLYSQAADQYFIPASNVKLFTTAAALLRMGAKFRWITPFYARESGAMLAELRVVGQGDPTLKQTDLEQVAADLHRQGVRRIRQLQVEDRSLDTTGINPTWEWGDLQAANAVPVSHLMVDENTIGLNLLPQAIGQPLQVQFVDPEAAAQWQVVNQSRTVTAQEPEWIEVQRDLFRPILRVTGQLRVGSTPEPAFVAVLEPSRHFLTKLQAALRKQGIKVDQAIVQASPSEDKQNLYRIAHLSSPPLAEVIATTNQDSNNLYAEALLQSLLAQAGGTVSPPTPEADPLTILQSTLATVGVDPQAYQLQDGSGLSRRNLATPTSLIQLLKGMHASPQADIFRASLAVAGQTGTLAQRLRGTVGAGKLQGKTGTLSAVVSLSGYLNPPRFSPLVFSVLVNQTGVANSQVRQAIDELVVVLTRLQSCGENLTRRPGVDG